jgi:monoamine oxidase
VRVIVLGAGFAGLRAAVALTRTGSDVTVLEARGRVGGRVWSDVLEVDGTGHVIERGAEFILDDYRELRAVAGRHGIGLAPTTMSYYWREPRQGPDVSRRTLADAAAVLRRAAGAASPGTSLRSLAEGIDADRDAVAVLVARLELTDGLSADELAAGTALDPVVDVDTRGSWRVDGGNQRIADALASELVTPVRLNTEVLAVDHRGDVVRVATTGGVVEADAAVVALPLAVVRTLPFEPEPPAPTRDVWRRAGVAHNAKLHVPIRGRPSAGAVMSVEGRYWCWTATDGTGSVQPVLHCFAGSPAALDRLDAYGGPSTWARRAAGLRPELSLDGDRAVVTTWNDDRFAGESYSAETVRDRPGDVALLDPAFPRVAFAGEHLAGDFAGLMEGALRSGLATAEGLVDRLRV